MNKFIGGVAIAASLFLCPISSSAAGFSEVGQYGRPFVYVTEDTQEQIEDEIYLGELELLAQLVHAEAGNQPMEGKYLVAEVVLNRVESDEFPDTISEVIFQDGQFSVAHNGRLEKAAWTVDESDYEAVTYAVETHDNKDVLYFNNCSQVAGTGELFKVGGHWFRNS